MRLTFLGAAGEVTGSCYLVETGETRFLIECGMRQGGRHAAARNRRFAFDPRTVDFVLLSHAHVDHSGLIPRLVAQGFGGTVFATRATGELLGVMLPDAGHLQEKEAEREGGEPLYTVAEAERSLQRLQALDYGEAFRPHPSVRCVFRDAGHILGSALLELEAGGVKLVFSGDLGQPGHPVVDDPATVREADVLLVESTYGDRNHKSMPQTLDEFAYALNDTLASKKGNVVIPSFAVGRTQDLLAIMGELQRAGRLPKLDAYVDSPMASAATRITLRHAKLPPVERVRFTESTEESMKINAIRAGAVIISASGMCEGGRIRYHLAHNVARKECALVFVGFQAAGTLGRRLVDGAKRVRIHGEDLPVRAKIFTINGLSAHADRDALLGWLGKFERPPRQTWVVHGEPLSAHALRDAVRSRYGWRAEVPVEGQAVELG
ncbi:MAG TPA: MBL fold metallo-hydrolase [Burkholderiales bacterium]|nr:MBL fold metallo-hydrolase [Burkholderiales bacterium]